MNKSCRIMISVSVAVFVGLFFLTVSVPDTWGQAGKWPTIELFIGQNNNVNDNVKVANPFSLQGTTISNGINPGINVNWNLFSGFSVAIQKSRLEQLQAESMGNADVVISNTIEGVILAYYAVILEKARLKEFGRQLNLSRDKYNYVKVKF